MFRSGKRVDNEKRFGMSPQTVDWLSNSVVNDGLAAIEILKPRLYTDHLSMNASSRNRYIRCEYREEVGYRVITLDSLLAHI